MTDLTLNRFASYLDANGAQFDIIDKKIYRCYNKMIVPFGPVEEDYSIDKIVSKVLMKKNGGILVRHHKPLISPSVTSSWYAVVCDEFKDLNQMSSKYRSQVLRGLNNCEAKRIDASLLKGKGFDIYRSALASYRNSGAKSLSKKQFQNEINIAKNYDDIVHYWGVFHQNKLIAYSVNLVYDKIEVSYSSIKFNPVHLCFYPSYALFYEMNRHYLQQEEFKYVSDGYRNLSHKTNIQDYLIKKFAFRKFYLTLNIDYYYGVEQFVNTIYPIRGLVSKIDGRIGAILKQERIKRSFYE